MRLSSLVLGCIACSTAAALPPAAQSAAPPVTAPSRPAASRPASQPASSPPSAAELAEFESIVRQLSDDDWRRRQSAQLRLSRLGPEFAPHLRKLAGQTSREDARAGCLEALARIDRLLAMRPAPVTLRSPNITPREALAELAKQAGADIRPARPSLWDAPPDGNASLPAHLRPISLDITDQPFWLAFRDVCRKANLRAESRPGVRAVYVADIGEGAAKNPDSHWLTGPAVASGPCVIVLDRIERVAALDLPDAPAGAAPVPAPVPDRSYTLKLVALCDPWFRLIEGSGVVSVTLATDEHGRSMLPGKDPEPPPAAESETSIDPAGFPVGPNVAVTVTPAASPARRDVLKDRTWEWPLHARLDDPAGGEGGPGNRGAATPARRLARFKAAATFLAVTKTERWEIDPVGPAREVSKEVGGRTYVFKRLAREGTRYSVNLTAIPADGADTPADLARRQQLSSVSLGPQLLDARGRPYKLIGSRVPADSIRYMTILFESDPDSPDAPGDPARLVWDLPAETGPVTIPLEFRDVPLP
jgi:hypothetical protein